MWDLRVLTLRAGSQQDKDVLPYDRRGWRQQDTEVLHYDRVAEFAVTCYVWVRPGTRLTKTTCGRESVTASGRLGASIGRAVSRADRRFRPVCCRAPRP
jgi:hypothetical protein